MSTEPQIPTTMRAVVMNAPGDVTVETINTPRVVKPTDVVLKLAAACVCGSDLWPYRGYEPVDHRFMGHEYVGTIVEKGDQVTTVELGDFVIGSFMLSDGTCEICQAGYQSRCVHAALMGTLGAQAASPTAPRRSSGQSSLAETSTFARTTGRGLAGTSRPWRKVADASVSPVPSTRWSSPPRTRPSSRPWTRPIEPSMRAAPIWLR